MSTNRYDIDSQTLHPIDRNITRLLYVTQTSYSEEWHSTLHTHNCSEIFFVTGGVGYLRTRSGDYSLQPNDVIILNPTVEHTELSSVKNPLEYIVLGVSGLELIPGEKNGEEYSIVHTGSDSKLLSSYLYSLLREIETRQPGYETICEDLLEIVLLHLIRRSEFTLTFVPTLQKSSKQCALVKRHIDHHFKENITLDDLADLSHVSKYYLVRSFTTEYGISPISYLMQQRIHESMYLLKNTDMTLADISLTLGFSSQSYFSQSFKRITGRSPLQYRKDTKDTIDSELL